MYHLHVRYITKSNGASAQKVMQYITRTGRYIKRGDTVREMISLNMPAWAIGDAAQSYWETADSGASRANARSAYVVECALPRSLPLPLQRKLVMEFSKALSQLSAEGMAPDAAMPITLAIHEGHGRNPHVHILISTSIHDGIERAPALWFMRHNSMKPEIGGAKRSRGMGKKTWLIRARHLWAELANRVLIQAGLEPSMDHRSHASRGLNTVSPVHLGPSAAHLLRQNKPAPRAERYLSARKRNLAIVDLQDEIEQTKNRLAAIKVVEAMESHAFQVWQAIDKKSLQLVLLNHPLAGDASSLKCAFSALVLESTGHRNESLYEACVSQKFDRKIVDMLPQAWQAIRTPAGLWLVRPGIDQLVLVGPGYLATDADDPVALQTVLMAAKLLPFEKPIVIARPNLVDILQFGIAAIGRNWECRAPKNLAASSLKAKP